MIIAIDGPSGAGKSTVAKLLATKMGIVYLDTGAMYRTVGLYMYENNVEISPVAVKEALSGCEIEVCYNGGEQIIKMYCHDCGNNQSRDDQHIQNNNKITHRNPSRSRQFPFSFQV